jgi:hypothetical protein
MGESVPVDELAVRALLVVRREVAVDGRLERIAVFATETDFGQRGLDVFMKRAWCTLISGV